MRDKIYKGTEVKYNIHIEPIDNLAMSDYNFQVEFFCNPRKTLLLQKSQLLQADANNYVARVDTEKLGIGDLQLKITAYIPDGDFADNLRTEIVLIDTNATIYR